MSDAAARTGDADGATALPAWLDRLAHDLRSAYSPMSLGIAMLGSRRLDPTQQTELLAAMQRQSDTLIQMLDDVADLMATKHGSRTANSVGSLFGQVVTRTAARLDDAGVTLEAQTPDGTVTVRGETRALVRVIAQLVIQIAQIGGRGSCLVLDAPPGDATAVRVMLTASANGDVADALASCVARMDNAAAPHLVDAAAHAILARHGARLVVVGGDAPGIALHLPARSA